MKVTIKEVALRAGVSIATVSRAFNDSSVVDERTKERVKKAAHELHYVPSALGRNLSTRKTNAIGLLLPDLFGEFFSEVIRGSDETAQQFHYHLIVSSSHSSKDEIDAALKAMRGRVDGLIVMSPHVDAQILYANLPHHLPVVLMNCKVDGDSYDSVTIDNYGGAYRIARHILDHGHKRVAILKGTENNIDALERLRGYRAAVADARYRCEIVELAGDFSEASGYDAVKTLLRGTSRPTAILASNDAMAIGALSALRDAGIAIPDEIALAGFDDIPIASYLTPSLTTVHIGINSLGVNAVEVVLHAIREKNNHQKRQLSLPTTLSIRESCGCTVSAVADLSKKEVMRSA